MFGHSLVEVGVFSLVIIICMWIDLRSHNDDKPVTVDQLPQKAQAFIKQYFADKQVSLAKQERDFFDKSYEVMFVNGEKVEFDKNGEWKDVDCKFSEVPADIIPQAIRTHIASLYPDAKVLQIDRDSRGYEVQLNNRLELSYNTSFQLTDIDD